MNRLSGQSLIEVLVALATIVIVVTSITYAVITSLKNSEFIQAQNSATEYSQQGMEILRQMRNSDYATFNSLSGSYCMAQDCISLNSTNGDPCGQKSGLCGQNIGVFVREIDIEQNSSSCNGVDTLVTVTTAWSDGQCTNANIPFCHTVPIASCLSNVSAVPSP